MVEVPGLDGLRVLGDECMAVLEGVRPLLHEEVVVVAAEWEEGDLFGCDFHLAEVGWHCAVVAEEPYPDRHLGLCCHCGELDRDGWLGAGVGDFDRLDRLRGFSVEQSHCDEGHLLVDVDVDEGFHLRGDLVVIVAEPVD